MVGFVGEDYKVPNPLLQLLRHLSTKANLDVEHLTYTKRFGVRV